MNAFGPSNVYTLSAGWGLVRSDFLLPEYDVTFSNQAAEWATGFRKQKGYEWKGKSK